MNNRESLEALRKELNEISVYDFSVFTAQELCYKIAHRLNEVIQEVLKQNDWVNYLLAQGVTEEFINMLNSMRESGELAEIVTDEVYYHLQEQYDLFVEEMDLFVEEIELFVEEIESRLSKVYSQLPCPQVQFFRPMEATLSDISLIKLATGEFVLVDAGDYIDKDINIERIRKAGCEKISKMFLTHNHSDHIGGALPFIKEFDIKDVYMKTKEVIFDNYLLEDIYQQQIHDNLINYCDTHGINIHEIREGEVELSPIEKMHVFSSEHDYDAYNGESLMFNYVYRGTNVLFGGDCTIEAQQNIYDRGLLPKQIHLFKMCHHGNDDGAFRTMFENCRPQNVVANIWSNITRNAKMMAQFYEGKVYDCSVDFPEEVLTFIISNCGAVCCQQERRIGECWDNLTIDGVRNIFFDTEGKPVANRVVFYKGEYFYLGYDYDLKTGWIEKNPGDQTLYYYGHPLDSHGGRLAQCEWVQYNANGVIKWCYITQQFTQAINRTLNINGKDYNFDSSGFCTNPDQ